ncbi:hypothetical protein DICPUDRAFT_97975 [Dictyostelium purpureum]|uniref:phosphoinositide 5-phosphatase n=1 Tax=Dictyostelium purpureum TaxID=5786 RepID=F0ZLJ6_DICPU|nr:uncharacterized protein DICPUDRAFT_97975 [Dictyostelium purpureum]EGC35188.1 hypothetical protein DICPUDRAFT_97975 [Dictyostelium purpureum]|eukprot:XP_003288276.1 hypothetical protein DICPUDRAFT_97975 [Dictyostelium purpureum]
MSIQLYSKINLIYLDSYVVLQPDLHKYVSPKSIFIDRTTLKIEQKLYENSIFSGPIRSSTTIYGCLGIINLLSGPYLLCITEFERVGSIRDNQVINRVTKHLIVPVARIPIVLNEEEKKEEKNYLTLLNDLLESCDLYYSYNFDVTQSEQRASKIESNPILMGQPLWKRSDRRFFWNYHLQQIFIENSFDSFIVPVMDGFIKIIDCEINSNQFKYIFISRRSCKRTGARYHIRGSDPLGNVANFVETEQIVVFDQVLTSFVQVRGSIPLIWQQKGKGLKPKPVVDNNIMTDDAFQAHMNELIHLYGPQVIVSLIDQIGGESAIGDAFESETNLLYPEETVRYYAFDFHEKCKNNRYDKLSELLDQVKPYLDQYGHLFKSTVGEPTLLQTGSFRTNCIDCLDRTNVVQSVFAHYILHSQLTRMGIISHSERIENHTAFEMQFKNIWADNADVMSEQYTGTVALKTDFTRTGKRSVKGTMTDGMNSVRRYINKNFKDDEKQSAIDLFLGKYVVEKLSNEAHNPNSLAESSSIDIEYSASILSDPNDPSSRGFPAVVRINQSHNSITSWLKGSGRRKDYYFSSIYLIEKSKLNHRQLNLYYVENPSPECFQFTSSLQREQFLQELYKQSFTKQFLPQMNHSSSDEKSNILNQKINSITNDIFSNSSTSSLNSLSNEFTSLNNSNVSNNDDNSSNNDPIVLSPTSDDSFVLSPKIPIKRKLLDIFNSYIGSWNMENININSDFLDEWLPKDKDLYSISAQRISADRKSPGLVMNYRQYWFYLIRKYLGTEYITVATAISDNTASIVLVRKSLANCVNNISVSYLQKRLPHKKQLSSSGLPTATTTYLSNSNGSSPAGTSPPLPSAAPPMVPQRDLSGSGSNSGSSSGSGNLVNFFFGSKKLKEMSSKIIEQSQKSTEVLFKDKYKDVQFGTTISLQIRETSLMFINFCNNNVSQSANPELAAEAEAALITYIKNKQYINGSSRYVFWAGDYDQVTLNKDGWNPLSQQSGLSNTEPLRGVAYWKSQLDPDTIFEMPPPTGDDRVASTMVKSPLSEACLFQPISCSFSLPILSPYTWLSTIDIPSFIIIRHLKTEQVELIQPGTKADAYLEMDAFHIISDEFTSLKTSTIRSSTPMWTDTMELKSFIDDKEYLKTQFIQVALVGKELMDISLIGKGIIPLKDACGDRPHHFRIQLTLEDEFSCFLTGDIQVFSKSEINKFIQENEEKKQRQQQQQSLQQPPPQVPSRSNRGNPTAPLPISTVPSQNYVLSQPTRAAPPIPAQQDSPNNKSPILQFKPPSFLSQPQNISLNGTSPPNSLSPLQQPSRPAPQPPQQQIENNLNSLSLNSNINNSGVDGSLNSPNLLSSPATANVNENSTMGSNDTNSNEQSMTPSKQILNTFTKFGSIVDDFVGDIKNSSEQLIKTINQTVAPVITSSSDQNQENSQNEETLNQEEKDKILNEVNNNNENFINNNTDSTENVL